MAPYRRGRIKGQRDTKVSTEQTQRIIKELMAEGLLGRVPLGVVIPKA